MAQAARLDLHAHLSRTELWHRDLLDGQWAAEVVDDHGTVGSGCSLCGVGFRTDLVAMVVSFFLR